MNFSHFPESANSLHITYSLRRRGFSPNSRRNHPEIWDKSKSYHILPYGESARSRSYHDNSLDKFIKIQKKCFLEQLSSKF